jgi:acyl-CoA synthetase (AMP-forming)/AMP-acid ligase II
VNARSWNLRTVPDELTLHYREQGWWSDRTLGQVVEVGLNRLAGRAFRVHSKVHPWSGTLGAVDRAARAFAASLAAIGVGPGDVVLMQLPNWVEAAITFWGAAYAGATVVPVVHFYGPKEVDYILRDVEPDVVVAGARFGRTDYLAMYEALLADHPRARWFVAGSTSADALPRRAEMLDSLLDAEPVSSPVGLDSDLPALVAFTSGTTSDPKGVIHTHRTIVFEIDHLDYLAPRGGPPEITPAPVGHFMGLLTGFLLSLVRDQPVNLIDSWDPGQILRLIVEDGLAVNGGVPYFLSSLLDHPDFTEEHLVHMPFAGMGGTIVPYAMADRAAKLGMKVFRCYGSTEHPSITGCRIEEPELKCLTTEGPALSAVEIGFDAHGQILSRGPDCFMGYTDSDLTSKVFDGAGWYHTGDVGRFDDDGYLTITDRLSDIIIRGGENISAREIEDLLLGLDAVAEVAVVPVPDQRLGERAAAVLRLHEGATMPTLDEVRARLAAVGLAQQKWPEALYQVGDFPRTASGKIQKFRVRQQLRDGDPED